MDGVLKSAEEPGVRQFDDLQAVLRLSGADPAVRLEVKMRILSEILPEENKVFLSKTSLPLFDDRN